MQTIYKLNSSDLNYDFLESVKLLFQNRDIEIVISDSEAKEDMLFENILENSLNNSSIVSKKEFLSAINED